MHRSTHSSAAPQVSRIRVLANIVVAQLLLGVAAAQSNAWVTRIPGGRPRAPAMAYDAARARLVLFGGLSAMAGTWEHDGSTWIQRTSATVPAYRTDHAMAYDAARKCVVMFGGRVGPNAVAETWEWDGVDWRQRTPAGSPDARWAHGMAFDAARGRIVLFGGQTIRLGQGVQLADTWEFDGSQWIRRIPAAQPNARVYHGMAYDAARQRVVLFGGSAAGQGTVADTWEWDGSNWTLLQPASSPSARLSALAYDVGRQLVVLFSGSGAGPLGDTWEWDGTNWSLRQPASSPPARAGHALVHDAARGRTVLFGGSDSSRAETPDLWEWDGTTWLTAAREGARTGRRHRR